MRVLYYRMRQPLCFLHSFFFNDTATTEIYTLSLHDALPIWTEARFTLRSSLCDGGELSARKRAHHLFGVKKRRENRSEEHTSELQSRLHLVCRLLLEKKNTNVARKNAYFTSHAGTCAGQSTH